MRYLAQLSLAALLISPAAWGGTLCAPGTLSDYEALGAAGCSIGSSVFSSFNTPSGINGATPIDPGAITITPSGSGGNPSLAFGITGAAADGDLLEALVNYQLSGASYTSLSVLVAGTSSSGNGAVTEIQNYCLGGTFDPSGVDDCGSGNAGNLLVLGNGNDAAMFPSVGFLAVTDDFTLDSGGVGGNNSAAGGTFTDTFTSTSAVPEPGDESLLAIGLAALAFLKWRTKSPKGDH